MREIDLLVVATAITYLKIIMICRMKAQSLLVYLYVIIIIIVVYANFLLNIYLVINVFV